MDSIFSLIYSLGSWGPNRSTCNEADDGEWGWKVLEPGTDPLLDIIAIHGLNGHRERTFTAANKTLWLKDLLPQEIPRARILTYGYDSRTHGARGEQVSKQTLNGHGIKFLSTLCLMREKTKTTHRPIIFIAHSLGGIVLKSALIHAALTNHTHNEKYQAVKLSTYGIMFLGTPHQGANGVSLAKLAANIVSLHEMTNDSALRHLEQHSEWLNDQLEQYKAIGSGFDTKFCFEAYETRVLAGHSIMIVPQWSACVPGAVNTEEVEIQKDHRNIVRFQSAADNDFRTLADHLTIMAERAPEKIDQVWSLHAGPSSTLGKAISRQPFQDPTQNLLTEEMGFKFGVHVPYGMNPLFVGRADPLKALDRILTLGQSRRVAVLHGPPGIGKTQIAVQFCHTRHTNFSSVFWLNASTKESIGSSFLQAAELIVGHYARLHFTRPPPYARIAEKLGLSGMVDETGRVRSEKTAVEGVKNAVMAWFNLESNTKWLIVYDNYDDPESFMIEEFIPPGSHGKIIVTSRRRGCASIGEGVALNLLDNPDAVDLLLRSCQISEASVSDEETAKRIVAELGNLPLALDQAGKYIFAQDISLRAYLQAFNANVKRVLSKRNQACGFQNRHDPVFKTFETSFVKIEKIDPVSAKILVLCSFYENEDVPPEIFVSSTNGQVDDHLEHLYSFSLAKRAENGYIAIHPLVRVCARERLLIDEKREDATDAFRTIVEATHFNNEHDFSSEQWALGRKCIPHLVRSSEWIVKLSQSPEDLRIFAPLWNHCALLHQVHGLYPQASMFYERALESQMETLGNEHLETARTKLGLAKLNRLLDQNDEAEVLYNDCFRVFALQLGSKALDTTQAIAGLGIVRWRQSRFPEAKSLLERGIEGYKRHLGSTHPETLVATEALGLVYKELAEYDKAINLIQEAIDSNTEQFGEEHPETVRNMQNLALCMIKLKRLDEAAQLQQHVLEIGERQLGSLHPTILRALHNMAYIHFLQDKCADAQPLCELAITGREKILGKDNLETFGSVELLGAIYFRRGLNDDAQRILRRAVRGYRSQNGGASGGILPLFRALDWLAQVCEAQGDLAQAIRHYEEALEGHSRILGSKHPTTRQILRGLQKLLEKSGSTGKAKGLRRKYDT